MTKHQNNEKNGSVSFISKKEIPNWCFNLQALNISFHQKSTNRGGFRENRKAKSQSKQAAIEVDNYSK